MRKKKENWLEEQEDMMDRIELSGEDHPITAAVTPMKTEDFGLKKQNLGMRGALWTLASFASGTVIIMGIGLTPAVINVPVICVGAVAILISVAKLSDAIWPGSVYEDKP